MDLLEEVVGCALLLEPHLGEVFSFFRALSLFPLLLVDNLLEAGANFAISQLVGQQLDAVLGQEDELHWLELLLAQSVELLNKGTASEHLLRLCVVCDHRLSDAEHKRILIDILGSINFGLPELGALAHHELEHIIELRDLCDRILDEVLVDGDALNDINNTLNIEH